MIIGVTVLIVGIGALVVCFVGCRRLKAAREALVPMDAIAPFVPEGGLKMSKNKSRAQAIQEQRSQMFRDRARFAASTVESSLQLRCVDEGKEMDFSGSSTDLESLQPLKVPPVGIVSGDSSSSEYTQYSSPRSVKASASLYHALVHDSAAGSSPVGTYQSSNENSGTYQSGKGGLLGSDSSWKGSVLACSQAGPLNYSGGGRGVPQRSSSIIVAEVTA